MTVHCPLPCVRAHLLGLGGAPTASTTVFEVLLPYCACMAGADRSPHSTCMQSQRRSKASAGRQPTTGARARSAADGPPAGCCSGAPIGARHHDWTPGARRSRPAAAVPCRRQALMAATTCKCSAPGSVSEQDSELKPQRLAVVPGIQAPSQLEPDLEHLHPSTHAQ